MADLKVNIGGLLLKNPVMTASGTFGYGEEFADFVDLSRLGGVIVKGTTLHHREGNPYPRMAETPSGMLNAVGLQNKGVNYFIENIYPRIKDIDTHFLVNVSGSSIEDYAVTAEKIAALDKIPGIELNISCPNVKEGGMAFGTSCQSAAAVVKAVRAVYPKTLIVKLSPNVTDITEIFVYSVRYFFSYLRIYEVSCSDLYGRCTGQYKFNGIGGVHDSTQSYNRDFYGMVSLPNHTQCDGLNTCTG